MPTPTPTPAPYGSWPSPVEAGHIARASVRLGQIQIDVGTVCWSEGRPQEQGRNVVVRCGPDGVRHDLNPAPTNARSRVHEYGGGAFVLDRGRLIFSNDADQRLYIGEKAGSAPRPLTHGSQLRYADFVVDHSRQRLVAVREDHRTPAIEPVNTLVAVDLQTGHETVLTEGHDFYAAPRLRPDGAQLAWLTWDHPAMPWDATTLWLADVAENGTLGAARAVSGGPGVSVLHPSWSPHGVLHFVSDRSGWWNLYRLAADGTTEPLWPMAAEFGRAAWAFGMSTYGYDSAGRIVCACQRDGSARLLRLDPGDGSCEDFALTYTVIDELKVEGDVAAFIGASATAAEAVVRLDLRTRVATVLTPPEQASHVQHGDAVAAPAYSTPEAIWFPTEGGLQAHAFFYPPHNPDHCGPPGRRPPLIVTAHGGPTGAASVAFKWVTHYWTSRGFAVVDVNYGGSTGFGRAYRERIKGLWGVVDVDDVVNAAKFLAERGDIDADRVAIRGSSAGGYTTLAALTFRDHFKAGASHYCIGDLETLARDTHKFESRYLDSLIGPYPAAAAVYRERSPVHHTDRLAAAMILFQGAEDKAVPPSQAEAMYSAVKAKGLPVAYLLFEGEQHGFRRAETIERVLEAELYFYGRVFGFTPAGDLPAIEVANLPHLRLRPHVQEGLTSGPRRR